MFIISLIQGGRRTAMRATTKKFTTVTAAFALAIGATFSLSGCFGNPLEDLVQGGAGEIIKNATGADVDLGGQSIPKDFPSQIPVAEGEIEFGGSMKTDGTRIWTLRIKSNDPSVFQKVQSQLLANGFEETFVTEGESAMGGYDGHGYNLVFNVDNIDGEIGVTYVVTESNEG